MTRIIVKSGDSFASQGTLTAQDQLIGEAGTASAASGAIMRAVGHTENLGTIAVYGASLAPATGATLIAQGLLTNAGAVDIGGSYDAGGAGLLSLTGSLENSGKLTVYGGGFAQRDSGLGGVLNVSAGARLQNAGHLMIAGGVGADGATLVDAGVLTNSGSLAFGSGQGAEQHFVGGAGTLLVQAGGSLANGGVLTIGGGGPGTSEQVAGALTNTGTFTLEGNASTQFYAIPAASLDLTGVLTNDKLLTVGAGYGGGTQYYAYAGFGATLTDAGLLTNNGTLVVNAVRDEYNPAGTAAVLAVTGSLVNANRITLYGSASSYDYDSGPPPATLSVLGTLTNGGTITIGAGTTLDRHDFGVGAALSDAGVLTNTGTIALLSGVGGSGGSLVDSRSLINNGVVTIGGGAGTQAAVFSITTGGTLTNTGTFSGDGVLDNQGDILAEAGSDIAVAELANDGTIQLAASSMSFISSAIAADARTGVLDLSFATTLTLNGTVSSNQSVDFAGSGATLALGDTPGFAGVLDGLGAASTLDFLNLDVTSASASGTTLTIQPATGPALHLTLGAPLASGTTLALTSDDNGGTDLLINQPRAAFAGGVGAYGLSGRETLHGQAELSGILTGHLPT
jgi:hypothetical protein